ncbi:hypothetical protein FC40_GL000035 [Ligilactobacillus hayakitensis DSM 18933 = JCM 14209]|uniref:Uncharacterized protein n=1 Tax=Ligilactobacillus hayakitensis DSM 18933 = JCM 14209 TaxID=1423755 RepID=A0A0R1WX63_9LACO|nr:hypothetical protein [Ligilactobacillus hayakitensis]KRM19491.1 hypothetical protein FC40_GL000035 [Ligilactobacillus hayakitensis DSM 18933 = JCM 14209]
MVTSDAQKKANQKWKEANKEKQKIYRYRAQAKKFIRDFATEKDLEELLQLIEERKSML